MENLWNGFEYREFSFQGRDAKVVLADKTNRTDKWMLKTEYFGAFPSLEIEMLKRGYNLAYVANETRWCKDTDLDAKKEFADFLAKEYGFAKECAVVGMSCGGMIGVKYAAKYPDYVAVLYLDAPVMNLLSCPAGLGKGIHDLWDEFTKAMNMELCDLISYRNNPIDVMHRLAENDKPVILVCGGSDDVVPYEENGKLLNDYYIAHGKNIKTIVKPDCGHHPHGLEDSTVIADFIEKAY